MKNRKILFAIVTILFAIVCLYSCNQKHNNVIKIGAILPLTGDLAKLGESGKNGLMLAQDYINSKMERKIDIIIEDGQGKPTNSISALNKLISINDSIIIFSIVSPVDLSILPIQEKKRFLFVSHSTHPKLSNVNNLVFRHSTTAEQESKFISDYLTTIKEVMVIYSNDDYGIAFSNQISVLKPEWEQISFDKDETNFNAIVNKINNKSINKIVLCSAGKNSSNIISKLREKGNNSEIVTTLGYKTSGADLLIENDAKITMINFKEILINNEYKEITDKFIREKGRKLDPAEIVFFNSALLVYRSIIEANSLSPSLISIGIKNSNYDLLGGKIKITEGNDLIPEIELVKHK